MSCADNIVSIRAYRTVKECQKLFGGYQVKLNRMAKADLLVELERYRSEAKEYPSHLLTIVKGEILMKTLREKALSEDLRFYATSEMQRLRQEITKRMRSKPSLFAGQ